MPSPAAPPNPPRPLPRGRGPLAIGPFVLTLVGLIMMVVHTSLVLGFVAIGGSPFADRALDARGVRVDADVLDVAPSSTTINGVRQQRVRYRYQAPDGAAHEGEQLTADRALLEVARRDHHVPADVDPEVPGRSRLAGARNPVAMVPLILAPLAAVGLLLLLVGVRGVARARRLYREGTAARATVKAVEKTNVRINRRVAFRLRYSFSSLAGTIEGSCLTVEPVKVGDEVWVLYDPAAPARRQLLA